MAYLNKEAILAAMDMPAEVVAVPEWGGDVMVQGLSGSERDRLEAGVVTQRGNGTQLNLQNFRAKLVALSIVDPETKQRIFGDADVVALGKKSAKALQRVFEVAQRLSGLTAADVEEMTGNSASGANGASGSASH